MSIAPLYELAPEERREVIRTSLASRRGGTVTGPLEGAYGEVYLIDFGDRRTPQKLAAKCPRFERFGSPAKARAGVENILRELDKAHSVYMIPWVNRFFDVQIILGWPFVLSRFRDGTMADLIRNPLSWTVCDRFTFLLQIVRCLILAAERGVDAHQDLKPSNVFFDDLAKSNVPRDSLGMHQQVFVADFGLANAYKEIGSNNGSRPYMAPEQHGTASVESSGRPTFDVFALGVIAHEALTDGLHPIGCKTSDVWPWVRGMPQKWNRKAVWEEWSRLPDKAVHLPPSTFQDRVSDLIKASLSVSPNDRPTLQVFEKILFDVLTGIDSDTERGFRMQVDHLEGLHMSDLGWPHMDERLREIREFYSRLT